MELSRSVVVRALKNKHWWSLVGGPKENSPVRCVEGGVCLAIPGLIVVFRYLCH